MSPTARYFRFDWEPDGLGAGFEWIEFLGGEPTRQVEHYGGRWFSSRDDWHAELGPGLADGPLSAMDYEPSNEVTADEFEAAWEASGAQRE